MMWVGLRCVPPALSSTRHHTIALCDFTLFTLKALLILPGSFFQVVAVWRQRRGALGVCRPKHPLSRAG